MDGRKGRLVATVLLVGAAGAGAVYLLSATNDFTKDRIAANERARLIESLNSVLSPELRGHDLSTVRLSVMDATLGAGGPIDVFIALESGRPAAAVFASVAPHGYNAAIRLLIGISPEGNVTGVRAVSHRETAGLGDAIEVAKSPWILQFDGANLAAPPLELWAVDKDEGAFDSLTGATVTSRAVVQSVRDTLIYFEQHRDELFAAAAADPAAANVDAE
jgi:electron transport complex protein RnfG